jgi:hypothetical protein
MANKLDIYPIPMRSGKILAYLELPQMSIVEARKLAKQEEAIACPWVLSRDSKGRFVSIEEENK